MGTPGKILEWTRWDVSTQTTEIGAVRVSVLRVFTGSGYTWVIDGLSVFADRRFTSVGSAKRAVELYAERLKRSSV